MDLGAILPRRGCGSEERVRGPCLPLAGGRRCPSLSPPRQQLDIARGTTATATTAAAAAAAAAASIVREEEGQGGCIPYEGEPRHPAATTTAAATANPSPSSRVVEVEPTSFFPVNSRRFSASSRAHYGLPVPRPMATV